MGSDEADKFAALGRFVQAFEWMNAHTRSTCTQLLACTGPQQDMLNIFLHHRALSARPLFEIMRGMFGELMNNAHDQISNEAKQALREILSQMNSRNVDLVEKRNMLIHGWWISSGPDDDPNELKAYKFRATAAGLKEDDTPQTIAELISLTESCHDASEMILTLGTIASIKRIGAVQESFQKSPEGRWFVIANVSIAT